MAMPIGNVLCGNGTLLESAAIAFLPAKYRTVPFVPLEGRIAFRFRGVNRKGRSCCAVCRYAHFARTVSDAVASVILQPGAACL